MSNNQVIKKETKVSPTTVKSTETKSKVKSVKTVTAATPKSNQPKTSKPKSATKATSVEKDKAIETPENKLDAQSRFWIIFWTIVTFGIFKIYLDGQVEKKKAEVEAVQATDEQKTTELKISKKIPFKVEDLIKCLGGAENITELDASLNSLRVTIKDKKLVDQEQIKKLGARGTMFSEQAISIIFGDYSIFLKDEMKKVLVDTLQTK